MVLAIRLRTSNGKNMNCRGNLWIEAQYYSKDLFFFRPFGSDVNFNARPPQTNKQNSMMSPRISTSDPSGFVWILWDEPHTKSKENYLRSPQNSIPDSYLSMQLGRLGKVGTSMHPLPSWIIPGYILPAPDKVPCLFVCEKNWFSGCGGCVGRVGGYQNWVPPFNNKRAPRYRPAIKMNREYIVPLLFHKINVTKWKTYVNTNTAFDILFMKKSPTIYVHINHDICCSPKRKNLITNCDSTTHWVTAPCADISIEKKESGKGKWWYHGPNKDIFSPWCHPLSLSLYLHGWGFPDMNVNEPGDIRAW